MSNPGSRGPAHNDTEPQGLTPNGRREFAAFLLTRPGFRDAPSHALERFAPHHGSSPGSRSLLATRPKSIGAVVFHDPPKPADFC